MRFAAVISLLVALAIPSTALAYSQASFGDWWVICDHQRHCTAFGFGKSDQATGFIRIERSGDPRDEPHVVIATPLPDRFGPAEGSVITMSVLGGAGLRTALAGKRDADTSGGAFDYYYVDASSADVRSKLIPALIGGRELVLSAPGAPQGSISLEGSAAALRWMDAQQNRAGTVTALSAVGTAPANTIPRPPGRPVVRAGKPVSQYRLPKRLPPLLRKDPDLSCGGEEIGLEAYRLTKSLVLWGVSCGGMYNIPTVLRLADEYGRKARPLRLEREEPSDEGASIVTTGGYDPTTRSLSEFVRGRGVGDCGTSNEWTWNGERFVRTSTVVMAYCRGVPTSYWAVAHDVEVRR